MNITVDYFKLSQLESYFNESFQCSQKIENRLQDLEKSGIQQEQSFGNIITHKAENSFEKDLEKSDKQDHENKISDNISLDDSIFLDASIDTKKNEHNLKENNCIDCSLEESDTGYSQENKTVFKLNKNASPETVNKNAIEPEIKAGKNYATPNNGPHKIFNTNTADRLENINNLSFWSLPELILNQYKTRKITTMFDWQVECLNNKKILENNANLVYSAPTSAGKTLVAEILGIKCIFERKKKVIFILPFISVVREKMFYFKDILGSSGVRVEGFMGSYNPPGGFQPVQLAIGTIEKCNSLINKLLQENKLSDIGMIIVDEVHLIGDPSRGYLLELLLTKLRYIMLKDENIKIQIVGMSATLPNLRSLAMWLDAELYTTDFRPIPLNEQIYVNGEIYNNTFKLQKRLKQLPELVADVDDVLQLCLETIETSCSVLIFCPTKNWCENLSNQIAAAFLKIGRSNSELGQMLRKNLNPEKILECLEQLKYSPVGLDQVLKNTVSFGVAFHHAGLTMEEREIIEGSFRNGTIRVLIATSTLSSGVNLPARRVMIRTPVFHGKPLDILTYRQMIGRAGRMGIDSHGESILICQKNDYNIAKSLTATGLKPVESCLDDTNKYKRAILEIIASGVASTPEDLQLFAKCTLMSTQTELEDLGDFNPIDEVVDYFIKYDFMRLQNQDGESKYIPTGLGKACLSSSISPGEGLELFRELEKARQCFVLDSDLHLVYTVTPFSVCHQWQNLDWMFFLDLWEKLPKTMKKVGDLVGVRESYIVNSTRANNSTSSTKNMIHKRFFIALALYELVNEKSLDDVAAKFNCNRGMLQSLQQSASTFAGMVTAFSRQLGWSNVELLISQFQDRLQFGVNRELLDLMRLPSLDGKRARSFFNSDIKTLVELANSDIYSIENILYKVLPFESTKEREGESEYEATKRNKMRNFWITGKRGMTAREAAEMILEDARMFLEQEMGISNINWGSKPSEEGDESQMQLGEDKDSGIDCNSFDKKTLLQDLTNTPHWKSRKMNLGKSKLNENKENLVSKKCSLESLNNKVSSNHNKAKPLTKSANLDDSGYVFGEVLDKIPESKSTPISNSNISSDDLFSQSLEETIDKVSSMSVTTGKRPCSLSSTPNSKKPKMSSPNSTYSNSSGNQKKDDDFSIVLSQSFKEDVTPMDLSKFEIVDICQDEELLKAMLKENLSNSRVIGLSLACSRYQESMPTIGFNVRRNIIREEPKFCFRNKKVEGFALTCDGHYVFYVSFTKLQQFNDKKIEYLQMLLKNSKSDINMFDCKEQIWILNKACGVNVFAKVKEPKVIDWLLEPDGREKSLHTLTSKYCPEGKGLSDFVQACKGYGNFGLDVDNSVEFRIRAGVDVILTWALMPAMKESLAEVNKELQDVFEKEALALVNVAQMDITGIAVDQNIMTSTIESIKTLCGAIEKKIYSTAGRSFNITSHKEVARVLGMQGKKVSTKKQVLEKSTNPISDLILMWRKLNCTMVKMLIPLNNAIQDGRIFGRSITHTSTGRISMHEPNLQSVAKDFDVLNPLTNETVMISCRSIFVAKENYLMVSADYCQLELRMLAHLSQDALLCTIMKSTSDIFRSISAKWNRVSEDMVTDEMRQYTKHICYGIIYGIGSKALSEQLKVEVEEATVFIDTFKNTYPGIKDYITNIVKECKANGYVETISGRRRFLSHIDDENPAIKTHAERQAVNTTIQGSAADLVKRAMISIQESLKNEFQTSSDLPKLVLHLHDELMYEVPEKYVEKTSKVIKKCMETVLNLSVPFPVKLKVGKSWGKLTEIM